MLLDERSKDRKEGRRRTENRKEREPQPKRRKESKKEKKNSVGNFCPLIFVLVSTLQELNYYCMLRVK